MVVVDPTISARTERLLLRPLRLEDAEDVVLMRENPEVMMHTSILPSSSLLQTQAWIQGCHDQPNNWNFAITLVQPHRGPSVIGLIGAVRAPEIGYMFNANYWGKGYATEALRAFMPLFFAHYTEFEYAEAHTDTELAVSQNVLTKVGFRLHEKMERDFENPVLGLRSTLIYRMYRSDMQSKSNGEDIR